MASLFERPKGARPALWYDLLKLDCEFVACAILQREESNKVSKEIATQEAQNGVNATSLTSIAAEMFTPKGMQQAPTRSATQFAQEDQSKLLGGALSKLNRGETYGRYFLYLMLHSRDRAEAEEGLTQAAGTIKMNGRARLEKEEEGALAAYLSMFSGKSECRQTACSAGGRRAWRISPLSTSRISARNGAGCCAPPIPIV